MRTDMLYQPCCQFTSFAVFGHRLVQSVSPASSGLVKWLTSLLDLGGQYSGYKTEGNPLVTAATAFLLVLCIHFSPRFLLALSSSRCSSSP